MGKTFLKETSKLLQAKRQRKRWRRTVVSMSLVVAMVTSSLLSHPAITMERTTICGIDEHTHGSECYQKQLICQKAESESIPATEEKVLNCSLTVHEHTDECKDENGEIICGTEAHAHDDGCYQITTTPAVEGHSHTDGCYQDTLICQKAEHVHNESCYQTEAAPAETAPSTEAPATEAPVTEAPATETPATSAPETSAPAAETVVEETEKKNNKKKETKKEKEETAAEENWKAQVLTAVDKEYTITVDASAEAKIPQGAALKVRELKKETDDKEYTTHVQQAEAKVQQQLAKDLLYGRYFELTIESEGEEVQPAVPVKVKITYTKAIENPEGSEVKAVYFGDTIEILNALRTNLNNNAWSEAEFEVKGMNVLVLGGIGTAQTAAEAPETEAVTESASEIETEITTEAATELHTEGETLTTESATEAESETEQTTETEAVSEAEIESETETEPATEDVTENFTETEIEEMTEDTTEAGSEIESESETEVESESESEVVTEEMTEQEIESESETEVESESESETEQITYAAGEQTAAVGNTIICVAYEETAGVPENAELIVSEIENPESYFSKAKQILGDLEVIDGHFYDIHFEVDGEEYPISGEVDVMITLTGEDVIPASADIKVVHFPDGEETPEIISSVNVSGSNPEAQIATMSLTSADSSEDSEENEMNVVTFTTNSFSVYGIVGTGDKNHEAVARRTYHFQNDDGKPYEFTLNKNPESGQLAEKTDVQIVKKGDQLLDVGIPTAKLDKNVEKEFIGWGVVGSDNQTSAPIKLPIQINDILANDEEVTLRAVFSEDVYITFYDVDMTTIIATVKATPNTELDVSKYTAVPTTAEQGFVGWSAEMNQTSGTGYKTTYLVPTQNTSLYPVIVSGHWLRFNRNDNDADPTKATYAAPVFVIGTLDAVSKPVPTRTGYEFKGWFEDKELEHEFVFEGTLDSSKTLYAKWEAQKVKYRIVYWQENPDDYGFSYYRMEDKEGLAGTTTTVTSAANLKDEKGNTVKGFHLHSDKETDRKDETHLSYKTQEQIIKGDGTTVVNVYYDRDIYKVNFTGISEKYVENSNGAYYYFPGGYIKNGNSYSNYSDGYYEVGKGPWSGITADGAAVDYYIYNRRNYYTISTTFIRYNTNTDDLTIEAKYGASIESQWPSRRTGLSTTYPAKWKNTATTKYQSNISTMPLNGATYQYVKETTGYVMEIRYYVQKVEGGDNFKSDHIDSFKDDSNNWHTTSDDYYELRGFTPIFAKASDASASDKGTVTDYVLSSTIPTENASIAVGSNFKNQNKKVDGYPLYAVVFYYARNKYDVIFTPNDGKADIEFKEADKKGIYYEADISGIAPAAYVKGETKKTESNGETLVFAGWYDNEDGLGEEYTFNGKTMPANNLHFYAKWTPITYTVTFNPNGGTLPEGQDATMTVRYGTTIAEGVLQETSREGYELIGWYKQNTEGSDTVFDFTSAAVTEDITLIAHWRKFGSYNVRYLDSDGTTKIKDDPNSYADQANVKVLAAPENIPTGSEFIGWRDIATGKLYYPGDVFTMNAENTREIESKDYYLLKAEYTELNTTYIQYYENGGNGKLTDVSEGNLQKDLPLNSSVTLSSGNGFWRTGYKLIAWNSNPAADGTETYAATRYLLSGSYGVDDENGNALYAEWVPVYIDISFTKLGESSESSEGTPLAGAQFKLQSNGKDIAGATAKSNAEGKVTFAPIQAPIDGSKITVVETSTPHGYVISTDAYEVSYDITAAVLGSDGKYHVSGTISNGTVLNTLKRTDITIVKTDEKGTAIVGAEFKLERSVNNAWKSVSTLQVNDINGLKVADLIDGTYRLTETKAPNGYIILSSSLEFTIEDGVVKEKTDSSNMMSISNKTITVKNVAGVALPNTGGSGTLHYTLSGLLLIAAALMYGFVLRRRRERRICG